MTLLRGLVQGSRTQGCQGSEGKDTRPDTLESSGHPRSLPTARTLVARFFTDGLSPGCCALHRLAVLRTSFGRSGAPSGLPPLLQRQPDIPRTAARCQTSHRDNPRLAACALVVGGAAELPVASARRGSGGRRCFSGSRPSEGTPEGRVFETGNSVTPPTALKPTKRSRSWIVESKWNKAGPIRVGPLNE